MSNLQGMYMNGPMAGRIISLPDPAPAKITVSMGLNVCKHSDPTQGLTSTFLTYSVNQPANPMLPYAITIDSNFEDTGWFCPQCKAEAEVKYKLDKIRELLEEDDDDEEEEW